MRVLSDVIKKNATAIIVFCTVTVFSFVISLLYNSILEPVIYSSAIGFFVLLVALTVSFIREKRKSDARAYALSSLPEDFGNLPDAVTHCEEDYQQMLGILGEEINRMKMHFSEEKQDYLDYYTNWVHQIKTPIAVMKLKLSDDTPENRAMSAELFRIEQYVDMVLQYIRLGSETNDLVIREYSLDEIIRETLRKYATQFIEKKLNLDYTPTDVIIVTDKKWFTCIIEQILSNAIKYTSSGTVSVSANDDRLIISDSGIGISGEDLPRIFEKGYTGINGRAGQKSSGLGLYLAKKAADMLNVTFDVDSIVGKGSSFSISLKKADTSQQ